jgi:hypothetical protein
MTTGVPNDESLSSSAWAKVDFPAPERPVSHTTNGREFIAGAEFIQSGRRPDVGAGVNFEPDSAEPALHQHHRKIDKPQTLS